MSHILRARAASALLVLVAIVLVPMASPAHAATPAEKLFVAEDTNLDGYSALFTRPSPSGARTAVTAESDRSLVVDVAASADGSRVIYVQVITSASTGAATQQVVVRDMSTRLVRVLESRPLDGIAYLFAPAISPNGMQAMWGLYDAGRKTYNLRTCGVALGGPTSRFPGYLPLTFVNNTTVLVQRVTGSPYTISYLGYGTMSPHPVSNLPSSTSGAAISPDGTKIAYSVRTSVPAGQPNRSTIRVASLAVSDEVASIGAATQLTTGAYDTQPAFSHDGNRIFFVRTEGIESARGDVWGVPVDGSAPASVTVSTGSDEWDVVVTASDDGTPPASARAAAPFVIHPNGTSAKITWQLPADADLSGVMVRRSGRAIFLPAPQIRLEDTGLSIGTTYTYSFTAIDRSGNAAPAVTRKLTAIKALPFAANPTSLHSTTTSFPVRLATGGTAGTTYRAEYSTGGGVWKTWITGTTGAIRTFGAAADTGVTQTPIPVQGARFGFRSSAVDEYGNTAEGTSGSPWVTVPYDETKATFSGGTTLSSPEAYLGTFRRLTLPSSSATIRNSRARLVIVGWRCPSCGSFAVYQGSTRLAVVSTYASSMQPRVPVYSKTWPTYATRYITIRPLGTQGHPAVVLDGFMLE